MRKVFDSLDHALLLQHLPQLGVYSTEILWFSSYLSDCVQRVMCTHCYSSWGPVLGGIPQGSAEGHLLFLIFVNDMPLQIRKWSLLQFADDTCLICCGDDHTQVKDFLKCCDLDSLARWIATSKTQVNVEKSSVKWFSVKCSKSSTTVLPVLLEGTP